MIDSQFTKLAEDDSESLIFESSHYPALSDPAYKVAVSRNARGDMVGVSIYDHVSMDVVDMPVDVALAIAQVVLSNVRVPGSAVN